jgi:hypothetical protein
MYARRASVEPHYSGQVSLPPGHLHWQCGTKYRNRRRDSDDAIIPRVEASGAVHPAHYADVYFPARLLVRFPYP